MESAGVNPSRVRPEAVEAMREIGIDISGHRSESVDEFTGREFDYLITVCDNARESFPAFPGRTKRVHWGFEHPAALEGDHATCLAAFPQARDQIQRRLRSFTEVPLRAVNA